MNLKLHSCLLMTLLSFSQCMMFRTKNKTENHEFTKHSLEWNGKNRKYILHLPTHSLTKEKKLPLLVMLHGRLGTGMQLMEQSRMNDLSDRENFIVVYPDGLNRSWADGRGNTPSDRNKIDDVGFLSALIQQIVAQYPVDPGKVFIGGHSNGGFMTQRMLLERSNLFSGGVSVAAQLSVFLVKGNPPKNPVSVAFIVGTQDPLVPYYGGYVRDGGEILGADDSLDRWKNWNECPGNPEITKIDKVDDGTYVDRIIYKQCKNQTSVRLIRVNEGGHSWPGQNQRIPFVNMGKPTSEIDGASEMVNFFKDLGL